MARLTDFHRQQWFLKALLSCSRLFLVVIFGALSWWFSWDVFRTLLLGI
jgi:hypothetical protein